ncbi:hypothetical protein OK016_07530 [Vibrio chagasii]|nr:hypothetical protein [Vibrio chagasii]
MFLGHRSYGFGAAARVYFGRSLDLTLSELATSRYRKHLQP